MALIYRENRKLFEDDPSITLVPVMKLVAVMLVSLPLCMGLVYLAQERSLVTTGMVAVAGMILLTVESYFVFGLKDTWSEFRHRMRARTA
jgi:hypothetical protein